ncbi:hypothetical protein B0G77_4937 [Paraburkholderia sp. BL10I2N1]|nr:hypothetical protein B0G77_4937 [Paraburkholderia sp. BL10I2N1]
MCPICLTTVALLGSAATSTGGLAALAVKKLRARSDKTPDYASLNTRGIGGEPQKHEAGAGPHAMGAGE